MYIRFSYDKIWRGIDQTVISCNQQSINLQLLVAQSKDSLVSYVAWYTGVSSGVW